MDYRIWIVIILIQFLGYNFCQATQTADTSFLFRLDNFDCELVLVQKSDSILLNLFLKNTIDESIFLLGEALAASGNYIDNDIIGISFDNWITDPMLAPWKYLPLVEIQSHGQKSFTKKKKGKVEDLKEIQISGCQIIESQIKNKRIKRRLQRSVKRGKPEIWLRYLHDEWQPNPFGKTIEIEK